MEDSPLQSSDNAKKKDSVTCYAMFTRRPYATPSRQIERPKQRTQGLGGAGPDFGSEVS
jgi:hypothetical protein